MKKPEIFKKEGFQINKEYLLYFEDILCPFPKLLQVFPQPFFIHKKRYREIYGYELKGLRFYLKIYTDCFFEAESEWKNLQILLERGFKPPKPIFYYKNRSYALIATEEVPGKPLSELLKENPYLLKTLANFMASFHKEKIFHQDCYLNHFYWDGKEIYILDVSRVKINPLFSLKYQIKDLAQLGYSFETYFGKRGLECFEIFLKHYENLFTPLSSILKFLLFLKIKRIRKRTENAKKKLKGIL